MSVITRLDALVRGAGASSAESATVPVLGELEPAVYPYINKGGVNRLPNILVLGNGVSPFFPTQTDDWVETAMLVDFPSTTYVADWRTYDPLVTPLSNFDSVVWMFDCDNYSTTPAWLTTDLFPWVNAGGGLIVTEWLVWQMAIDSPDASWRTDFATMIPVGPTYGLGNYNPMNADPVVTDATHPMMRTFGATIPWTTPSDAYCSESTGFINGGSQVATVDVVALGVQPFAVVRDSGSGLLGWINYAYFGAINPGPATDVAQLMRNAAWWAAGGTVV